MNEVVSPELIQVGAVAIIFFFAIKEFFRYLANKHHSTPNYDKDIALIRQQLENHMAHACEDLRIIKHRVSKMEEGQVEINRKLDRLLPDE